MLGYHIGNVPKMRIEIRNIVYYDPAAETLPQDPESRRARVKARLDELRLEPVPVKDALDVQYNI